MIVEVIKTFGAGIFGGRRRAMRRLSRTSGSFRYRFFAVLLVVIVGGVAVGQTTGDSKQQTGATGAASVQASGVQSQVAVDGAAQKEMKVAPKSPEEERQAQLVADTNKLYELAQELKVEVAKSDKNTLSISVIKKATEVEKLARSLKERMRKE
ncbi:MAG: hypothetical protein ABI072_03220 [Edaphobacter sp.]